MSLMAFSNQVKLKGHWVFSRVSKTMKTTLERPGTLFYCEAEDLDNLSRLDLGL